MANPLIDPTTSDASPHILIHPSVLITINDHASRSGIRHQGPVVGALLGRHDGKSIVVEQAFECGSKKLQTGDVPRIDPIWFGRMVNLQSEIFPELGLIGWYTFGAAVQSWHSALQIQFRQVFDCESPIFLLYQTQRLANSGTDGSLPLEVFEGAPAQVQDGGMEIDAVDKFRSIPYSLDTPADEAIGLADIMQGAAVAIAVADTISLDNSKEGATKSDSKLDGLTPEEDELISALETKANAIKMLQLRLSTIITYLQSQPPSYLTDASLPPQPGVDHEILRSISTLSASLTLTSPAGLVGYTQDTEQARTDGKVVELLAQLTQTVGDVKLLGKHVHAAEKGFRKEPAGVSQTASQGFDSSVDWT